MWTIKFQALHYLKYKNLKLFSQIDLFSKALYIFYLWVFKYNNNKSEHLRQDDFIFYSIKKNIYNSIFQPIKAALNSNGLTYPSDTNLTYVLTQVCLGLCIVLNIHIFVEEAWHNLFPL